MAQPFQSISQSLASAKLVFFLLTVTLALSSQGLLKLCILTVAPLEYSRLAGEGQEKFADKGHFGGGRNDGGEDREG